MENIYLISSSSYRLMEEEIHKIFKDVSYTTYDLNYQLIDDILDEANYYSLFDEKKYLLIKNANMFSAARKKEESPEGEVSKKDERLLEYLNNPNPHTIIVFTTFNKPAANKKIFKIINEKYKYIRIDDLKISEIQLKIDKLFKDDGFKCSRDIEYYIINNSLNNYDLAYNEVEKIKLYYGKGCEVNLKDVSSIVSRSIEDNNFKFIDAVMNRKMKDSFIIYDDLIRQKIDPIMLLVMLAKEFRNILLYKKLQRSESKKDIFKTLGYAFEFQFDKTIAFSYNFEVKQLEEYLLYLANLDYKIKNNKINNKRALELFLLYYFK